MKKIILAAALLAFVGSAALIAGGDKEKEKKSCSKEKSCCSKSKASCEKKSGTEEKKTEEKPQ